MNTATQLEAWKAQAHKMGMEAGLAAASWVTDGNDNRDDFADILEMLDNGDPQVDEYLPQRPDLSGEWADSPTPRSLFEDITGLDAHAESSWNYDGYQAVLEVICEAWEDGVSEVFETECERILREAIA